MNTQATNPHNQSGYESLPYEAEEEIYLSDHERGVNELAIWLNRGAGLSNAFKLLKVEEGFELTIPDYEQNGTYWLLGDKPAKTRAGALQRLGAALDAINEPDRDVEQHRHSVPSSLALASQKTAFNSPEP